MVILNLQDAVPVTCWVNRHHLRLFIAVISISAMTGQAHAESPEREFASHALALRQSALDGEQQFSDVMNRMPGSGILESETLSWLWSLSFPNMIVKLGRHRSEAPVSLYYDPLLDIAVLAFWERDGNGYGVKAVRALPGAWMGSGVREPSAQPPWIGEENALSSLLRTAGERLEAFEELHPPGAHERGRSGTTFAEAAEGMRAVMARLAWNAGQRVQWTEPGSSRQWLVPLLEDVERALLASDVRHIMEVAPETDSATAEALARLPGEYVKETALDLVVGSSESRLLIASSPADGDTYIMATCQISASLCLPSRLALLSLTD